MIGFRITGVPPCCVGLLLQPCDVQEQFWSNERATVACLTTKVDHFAIHKRAECLTIYGLEFYRYFLTCQCHNIHTTMCCGMVAWLRCSLPSERSFKTHTFYFVFLSKFVFLFFRIKYHYKHVNFVKKITSFNNKVLKMLKLLTTVVLFALFYHNLDAELNCNIIVVLSGGVVKTRSIVYMEMLQPVYFA